MKLIPKISVKLTNGENLAFIDYNVPEIIIFARNRILLGRFLLHELQHHLMGIAVYELKMAKILLKLPDILEKKIL